jgi:hypothetical protein
VERPVSPAPESVQPDQEEEMRGGPGAAEAPEIPLYEDADPGRGEAVGSAAPGAAEADPFSVPESAPPKKRPKKRGFSVRAAVLGGVALAAVVVLCVVNASALANLARKTFLSPEQYYQYVESQALSETVSAVATVYELRLRDNLQTSDQSVSLEAVLTMEDEARTLLTNYTGVDFSWLGSVGASIDAASSGNTSSATAALSLGSDQLLSCTCVADMDNQAIYLQFPELSDAYVEISLAEFVDEYAYYNYGMDALDDVVGMLSSLYDHSPDQATVEKVLNRYVSAILECVDDVDKGTGKLSASGVSQTYTTLEVTIDAKTAQKAIRSVLQELRKDSDLEDIILNFAELAESEGVDPQTIYRQFVAAVDEALQELNTNGVTMDDVVMTVWVDDQGEIRGRKIEVSGAEFVYAMPKDGKKFGLELSADNGYSMVSLTGKGTISDDVLSGSFTLSNDDVDLCQLEVSKWDIEQFKSGYLNGTFTIQPTYSVSSLLASYQLTLSAKSDENSASYELGVDSSSGRMATLYLAGETGKSTGTIAVPKDTVDLETWTETWDVTGFLQQLRESDLPSEWIDELLGDVSYYFYWVE